MTDYTKSTNFASKDALLSGNPLKIVKGTELDTEFNNIATAVATKADIASPTFTGTPAAPTASVPTNTTQLATTAFAMQAAYPVGSIYMNASVSTNPATLFGFGTWTAIGAGRMLVGYSSGDSLFGTAGNTGGSRDAIVVSHTHTASQNAHTHTYISGWGNTNGIASGTWHPGEIGFVGHTNTSSSAQPAITVDSTGLSATDANLPPYLTVYMWQRTA